MVKKKITARDIQEVFFGRTVFEMYIIKNAQFTEALSKKTNSKKSQKIKKKLRNKNEMHSHKHIMLIHGVK